MFLLHYIINWGYSKQRNWLPGQKRECHWCIIKRVFYKLASAGYTEIRSQHLLVNDICNKPAGFALKQVQHNGSKELFATVLGPYMIKSKYWLQRTGNVSHFMGQYSFAPILWRMLRHCPGTLWGAFMNPYNRKVYQGVARWRPKMSELEFGIVHRAGIKHQAAGALLLLKAEVNNKISSRDEVHSLKTPQIFSSVRPDLNLRN